MPVPNITNAGTTGAVTMKEQFPQYLYHPTLLGSRRVDDEDEKLEARREGWREGYRYQEYPKMLHHPIPERSRVVNNKEEEDELVAQGYAYSPAEFTNEKILEARIAESRATLLDLEKKREVLKKEPKSRS